ncbi:MAG: hypothetical protein KGV57_05020 [Fusobacterium sp.]|nr:hypothetical protein [Fusobacterium sp.]
MLSFIGVIILGSINLSILDNISFWNIPEIIIEILIFVVSTLFWFLKCMFLIYMLLKVTKICMKYFRSNNYKDILDEYIVKEKENTINIQKKYYDIIFKMRDTNYLFVQDSLLKMENGEPLDVEETYSVLKSIISKEKKGEEII